MTDDCKTIDIKKIFEEHPLPDLKKNYTKKSEFISDTISVSNLILRFLAIVASLYPEDQTSKLQQGILVGNMARLFKLYDSFLLLICEHKYDSALLLARALIETAIVLKYLIHEINDDICQKYIKSSLVNEKRQLALVQKKSDPQNLQEFEKRLVAGINNAFEKSGYKIEDIDTAKDKKWHKGLDKLAAEEKVGLEDLYNTAYRILSGAEHGSWHNLEFYHLIEKDNYYEPELNYQIPHPFLIGVVNCICLLSTMDYYKKICGKGDFIKYALSVMRWNSGMIKKYDAFILESKS